MQCVVLCVFSPCVLVLNIWRSAAGYYIVTGTTGTKTCTANTGQGTASFKDLPICSPCINDWRGHYTNPDVGYDEWTAWRNCPAGMGRVNGTGTDVSYLECENCGRSTVFGVNEADDQSECGEQPTCGAGLGLVGATESSAGSCEPCGVGYFSQGESSEECEDGRY